MDNLDGTYNHRALECKQKEEKEPYQIAYGSKSGIPIPTADEKEKQCQTNGGNQYTPYNATERESEKFEQAPHSTFLLLCQERLIPIDVFKIG